MIVFFDVNTIWRRKFGDALKRRVDDVSLIAPFSGTPSVPDQNGEIIPVRLIRGWAGILAWLAMPRLLHRVRGMVGFPRETSSAIVVTTPHYLRLVQRAAPHTKIVYYCSDDYRSYAGWNAARMAKAEATICRMAALSIFVSEALRQRAILEYRLDPAKTWVSPNATEPRFAQPCDQPFTLAGLPGPVFGTAGIFNRRIDFTFLEAIAADEQVGTLVLVGPIEAELEGDPALERLRTLSKVRFTGAQPHSEMPQWMAAFDVAVIPYAATEFNRFCSPMRLYDHLAIGQPIIATLHCDQITQRDDVLTGEVQTVPDLVARALTALCKGRVPHLETWDDRIDALQKSAVAGALFPQ